MSPRSLRFSRAAPLRNSPTHLVPMCFPLPCLVDHVSAFPRTSRFGHKHLLYPALWARFSKGACVDRTSISRNIPRSMLEAQVDQALCIPNHISAIIKLSYLASRFVIGRRSRSVFYTVLVSSFARRTGRRLSRNSPTINSQTLPLRAPVAGRNFGSSLISLVPCTYCISVS